MTKLKKEELLNILETAFRHLLKDINYKETKARYEQAYQQIRDLITWYFPVVIEQQKPQVTEEFMKKWSEEMANYWLGQEDDYFVKDIKRMLKEAGIEIPSQQLDKGGK